jgi:hypothetical protein
LSLHANSDDSSQYGSGASEGTTPPATHDISRVSYHVKHLDSFVQSLQDVSRLCSGASLVPHTELAIVCQQGIP